MKAYIEIKSKNPNGIWFGIFITGLFSSQLQVGKNKPANVQRVEAICRPERRVFELLS